MADEEQGFLRGLINRPVENFRNGMSEWRQHPVQEGLQRLLGVGASAIGGPGAGMAVGQGADRFFNWYNNRGARNVEQFRPTAEGGMRQFSDELSRGIWNQQRPTSHGSPGGMPGITSQWSGAQQQGPQQGQFGALGQLLGLPDYNQGRSGSPGAAASPQQPGSPYTHSGDEINSGPQQSMPTLPPVQAVMPSNTVGNISSGGARDAFAGSSGSSDPVAAMTSLLGLGSQSGGLGSTRADIGDSALRRRVRDQLRQDPNNAAALSLREQFIANRGGGR